MDLDEEEYQDLVEKTKKRLIKYKGKSGNHTAARCGKLVILPDKFDENAPPESKKSVMPIMLNQDGNLIPTNVVLDPYWRKPLLGDYKHRPEIEEIDEHEAIEVVRGPPRHKYQPLGMKINRKSASDNCMREGRTLINYDECQYLHDSLNDDDLKLLAVPFKKLSITQVFSNRNTIMHDVKNGEIQSGRDDFHREEARKDIMEVLRCHSLSMPAWERFVLILTTSYEQYSSNEDEIDDFERKGKRFLETGQNAFSVPIYVDMSVVNIHWETKEVYPRKTAAKRSQLDASIHETNDAKRSEMDSYSKIADYINQLEEMILTATNVKPDQMAELINKHAEIAQNAINELDKVKTISANQCHNLETERIQLQNQLNANKQASANQLEQISQVELTIAQMESQHDYVVNELKKKLEEEVTDNVQIRSEMNQKETEFEGEKNAVNQELDKKKKELDDLQTQNAMLIIQMEEKQDQINDEKCNQISLKSQSHDFQEESIKQRRKLIRQQKVKPEHTSADITMDNQKVDVTMFSSGESEEEEDDEKQQVMSPQPYPKPRMNTTILSLTPSKAGIPKFNPSEQSFVDWLQGNQQVFSWLKSSSVPDEQIVRLIILSLPPQMTWIGQNLTTTSNLETAKKEMLELVMGQASTVKNFLSVTKGLQEHPLAFYQRLKNYLLSSNVNLNDKFAITTMLERLYANLDGNLATEMKRQLGDTVNTCDKVFEALKKAIKLTSNQTFSSNMANLQLTSTQNDHTTLTPVNAFQHRQQQFRGNCYECDKYGHYARDCNQRKNKMKKSYNNHGQRETKTPKTGTKDNKYKKYQKKDRNQSN